MLWLCVYPPQLGLELFSRTRAPGQLDRNADKPGGAAPAAGKESCGG